MKLLEALTHLDEENVNLLSQVISTLETRLYWLEEREPSSNGETYDKWNEKVDYLQNAIDSFNEALGCTKDLLNAKEQEYEKIKELILEYIHDGVTAIHDCQDEYGGLSKLVVYYSI